MKRTKGVLGWVRWWWRWRTLPRVEGTSSFWRPLLEARKSPSAGTAAAAVRTRTGQLQQRRETLALLDFGAGQPRDGQVFHRRVADLARSAGTDRNKALWLHAVVEHRWRQRSPEAGPARILEVGTSLGLGALAMLSGRHDGIAYTGLEGSPEVAQWAQAEVSRWNGDVVVGPFDLTLPEVLSAHDGWDVVFLDGHHEGAALKDQWNQIRSHLRPGACVILDDIRWSDDMHMAWLALASQPDVCALDLFRMGVLTLQDAGDAPIFRVPTQLLA